MELCMEVLLLVDFVLLAGLKLKMTLKIESFI